MPATPIYIEAPAVAPAPYNLLETIKPKPLPSHGGLAGVQYDMDYCGRAEPWTAPCLPGPNVGTISVSVNNARLATITGTGEPAGTYVVDWGDAHTDTGALDGQTNTYAADGTYTVSVTGANYTASTTITVTNAATSGPFTGTAVASKVAVDGIDQTTGEPITIYHLSSCRLIASGDREARAKRALDLGASRAVEEGFGSVIGSTAVDVTPGGTAVRAKVGLALLEQYAGANYGGTPVLHMARSAVTIAAANGLIKQVGDHLETILGSLVVAGAGYADSTGPSAPATGSTWAYATGAVNIWEQDVITSETVLNTPYDNQFYVLAERLYVPTFECFAAAVEIDVLEA